MRWNMRRTLLGVCVALVLYAIAIGIAGVMTQPMLSDASGRPIDASVLNRVTAVEGETMPSGILGDGPPGFTLAAERDWWQARARLTETLHRAQSVTLSVDGQQFVASVTQPSVSSLSTDLSMIIGAALLFVFGCVLIAERHPSAPGLMLSMFLMPGVFVLLAASIFSLVQVALPQWIHKTLFALTALGNAGLAAGLHFALIFPHPHPRWRIRARKLWLLHACVIGHGTLVAFGMLAYATLYPVALLLAGAMTALLLQRAREEHDGTLKLHLLLLASPLPIAFVLLFVFYAYAPQLGLPSIDGSYLPLAYLIALVVYAAIFENAILQQRRIAERHSLREELHDDLLARLANISLMSEIALQSECDRDSLAARLASIRSEARANAAYARGLLRVSADGSWEDFCAQMRETGVALTHAHGVDFQLAGSGQATIIPPAPMRICLYKMLGEAIHNTLKHARASTITVDLSLQGDTIHFRYCDDGIGFDEHTIRADQFGLALLRRRAQALGSALHIESSTQMGTTLAFSASIA